MYYPLTLEMFTFMDLSFNIILYASIDFISDNFGINDITAELFESLDPNV